MYIIHFTCMQSEARKLSQVISYYTLKYLGTLHIHCNKTLRRIPPPRLDGAIDQTVRGGGHFVPSTSWYSPLACKNVKYQHGRGTKCSGPNRGLFHSQNFNFPEESFILISFYYSVLYDFCFLTIF
jgi:hypothetical protein